jgi:hypothetical protein
MTEKTPDELRTQRAQLIASTGLSETVLRERAEAFQLYPEHMDVWRTVEGIDYLLVGVEKDTELAEAQRLARGWEEKYFEMAEKRTAAALEVEQLRKDLAAARAGAGDQVGVLAPMFEGLARLMSTSSRDWSEYRVDAWLWAVLVGWECEKEHTHDIEMCLPGTLEEIAAMHGWGEAAIAKARRYRAAVRAVTVENKEAGR